MKIFIATLAIVFAIAGAGLWLDNRDGIPGHITSKFHNNTYVLSDKVYKANRSGAATGVWINHQYILTNCHVASDLTDHPFATKWDESITYKLDIVECDQVNDLALYKARASNVEAEVLKVDWKTPRFASRVYSAGYRFNMDLAPKVGLTGKLFTVGKRTRLGITMPIAPGDSGSPVFNSRGNLTALIVSVYATQNVRGFVIPIANISIGIPGLSIERFLKKHMEGYDGD